jgi:hypothetical protein
MWDGTERGRNAEVGTVWAYREKAFQPLTPIRQVEVVKLHVRKRSTVRVRFLDGDDDGLEEWVPKVRLIVPWRMAAALIEDERRFDKAWEASEQAYESLEYEAADEVFGAYPRVNGILLGWRPAHAATIKISDLNTVAEDLHLDPAVLQQADLAFVDRNGNYIAPWPVAVDLAHRICTVMPDVMLARIGAQERELRRDALYGRQSTQRDGEVWQVPAEACAERLREQEPIFALVRQWCGVDHERFDELQALRREVDRLGALVERAISTLERSGHTALARSLSADLGVRVDSYTTRLHDDQQDP